ncbi:hypothetical protein PCE1_003491 [Barthelona sp. PCE]
MSLTLPPIAGTQPVTFNIRQKRHFQDSKRPTLQLEPAKPSGRKYFTERRSETMQFGAKPGKRPIKLSFPPQTSRPAKKCIQPPSAKQFRLPERRHYEQKHCKDTYIFDHVERRHITHNIDPSIRYKNLEKEMTRKGRGFEKLTETGDKSYKQVEYSQDFYKKDKMPSSFGIVEFSKSIRKKDQELHKNLEKWDNQLNTFMETQRIKKRNLQNMEASKEVEELNTWRTGNSDEEDDTDLD